MAFIIPVDSEARRLRGNTARTMYIKLIVHQSSTAVTTPSGEMGICPSTLSGTGLAHDCPVTTPSGNVHCTD